MIKKQHKLSLTKFDFKTKPYKTINHKYFTLFIYKNNLNYYRIGILMGKNFLNKAVLRNKIKRMIFNYSQILLKEKNNTQLDFLFKIKPEIKNVTKQELFLELEKIFKNS